MLEFHCPTCGKRVQGDDSFAGKHVVCPGCNATLTAPGSAQANADTAIAEGAYPLPNAFEGMNERDQGDDPPLPSLRKQVPSIFMRWVPVLVLVIIVVTAVGLLIPPVQMVGDYSARRQSTNNLKQIGLAMQSFHDANKRLPFNGTVPAAADDPKSGSWAFQITPYIDSQPMFHELNKDRGMACYMCPGRGRIVFSTTGAWTDYFINPWLNDPKNGAPNAPDSKLELKNITDGASNTIFAGHGNIDPLQYAANAAIAQSTDIFKGCDPALARRLTTLQRDTNGDASLTWGGPFPQGALVVWCDGTVRLIAYSTPTGAIRNGVGDGTFAAYLTPTGKENVALPD
jgi:type II secretory pathway pseudopilin PulG